MFDIKWGHIIYGKTMRELPAQKLGRPTCQGLRKLLKFRPAGTDIHLYALMYQGRISFLDMPTGGRDQ
jgi:hypothetical protein